MGVNTFNVNYAVSIRLVHYGVFSDSVPFDDITAAIFEAGAVYVYYGVDTPIGLAATLDVSLSTQGALANFGWSVTSTGVVDQDGYADIMVGAFGCSHLEVKEV